MTFDITPYAAALGYFLLGGIFVFAGIDHFRSFQAVRGMVAGRGWPLPGPLLASVSTFQIVAGLCLVLGPLRPWAALGLAAFTVAASLSFLDFWRTKTPDRTWMRSEFTINVGLVGGLILAFAASL
ncbi:DoxX family protein [Neotabrizicola shimadae]|uniref:DoxX family protein n=1 Tax=Neotabrizicola shimadae TaxID=2807096 RepID=A0A8G0ZWI7_9RHOB|nr:DoxX family protein [Neotabrizicola shimadae]QYZ69998.1 DoxX family protein [Neotabrizicola shimadae]